jgi:CRP/FNR family transcriptional regulator
MKRFCNVCIYETLPYQEISVPSGTIIFNETDKVSGIYRIDSGFVKILKYHETGEEKIFDILGPNDFLALLLVLQNKDQYIATAISISDVKMRKITAQDTLDAYKKNTMFQKTCINCALGRANVFHNQLFQIDSNDVDEKIKGVLSHLYHKFGSFKNGNHTLYLPITQTDLASIIGIRRETLSRRLKVLQDNNVLKISRHNYTFFNL